MGGGVVVAAKNDDGAAGGGFGERGEEVVVEPDDALRWGGRVKNIASDEEGVCTGGVEGGGQPGEKVGVLGGTIEIAKGFAKVPIGGVDEAEGVRGLGQAHGGR